MAQSKLFSDWTWRLPIPKPFDDLNATSTGVYSTYNSMSTKRSTLHAPSLYALMKFAELSVASERGDDTSALGAIGQQKDKYIVAEYPGSKGPCCVAFTKKTGKFVAVTNAGSAPKSYTISEKEQSGSALLFTLIPKFMQDEEFKETFNEFLAEARIGYPEPDKVGQAAYQLCDNMYRRIENAKNLGDAGVLTNIPTTGNIPMLTATTLKNGNYAPDATLYGEFQVMTASAAPSTTAASLTHSGFVGLYRFDASRVLTPEEQSRVPVLGSHYVIPHEAGYICEHMAKTTGSVRPMRNIMLRGPAGTGKTLLSKAVAAGIVSPYVFLNCNANSEIHDIFGQVLPDLNRSDVQAVVKDHSLPSLQDIQMDPATAYHMMTGEYLEEVCEDDVLYELARQLNAADKTLASAGGFTYVESPLTRAMERGYVIELQEPTVIGNPGVLVGLNSLLDDCQEATLPTGKRVKRHPDSVLIVTTNTDYFGCRPLNQSFTSRMNLIIDMEEPDIPTTVKRVMAVTGCTDVRTVRMMAEVTHDIQTKCRQTMITDGTCGMREIEDWVLSFMITGDPYESALHTVIASASANAENREELISSCLEVKFTSKV